MHPTKERVREEELSRVGIGNFQKGESEKSNGIINNNTFQSRKGSIEGKRKKDVKAEIASGFGNADDGAVSPTLENRH